MLVIAGLCLFSIAALLCVIDLSKVSLYPSIDRRMIAGIILQLQRDNHRSLLEQSTYLVTHYYFVRLPISLLIITVCILTPFAVTWRTPTELHMPTTIQSNLSYSPNDVGQYANCEKKKRNIFI